jgi:amidase
MHVLTPTSSADNPEAAANGPISLQLYGRKNEEEAVLRMTEIVDAALKATK